jgi:hypothetical protein
MKHKSDNTFQISSLQKDLFDSLQQNLKIQKQLESEKLQIKKFTLECQKNILSEKKQINFLNKSHEIITEELKSQIENLMHQNKESNSKIVFHQGQGLIIKKYQNEIQAVS